MTDEYWSLSDELAFVRNLGYRTARPPEDRIALLLGYLEGLKLRNPDNGLDLEACRMVALARLADEERLARSRPRL